MPKIDPNQLLNCLQVLLSQDGGIKSDKDVARIAGLMDKYSKKLVSKCIYVQILKCTNTDLLEQFMQASGWNLVHIWLCDAIHKDNWPFVQEVLELLLLCPVDVDRLKSNSAPRLVKNLSQSGGNNIVKHLANKLVDQWLKIVKQSSNNAETPVVSPVVQIPQKVEAKEEKQREKFIVKIVNTGNEMVAKIETPDIEREKTTSDTDDKYDENGEESDREKYSVGNKSPEEDPLKEKEEKKDKSSKDKGKSSRSSSSSSKKSSSSSSSSGSSRHRSSSSSKSSSRSDREKSSSSSDKNKERYKSSSSSSSSSKSYSRDSKDREKERQRLKEKERLSSSSSKDKNKEKDTTRDKILEKLAKIPKKPKEENKEEETSTSITIPSKKASISIEIKKDADKSSAVKTYKSQFRSHGLTEEAPPPPSRKGLKKPVICAPQPGTVIPSSLSLKRPSPPPKDSPSEKRAKIDIITSPTLLIPEKAGGVKLIAPKPKPQALVETNIFSDALAAAMVPKKDGRKRKVKTKESLPDPESPQKVSAPLKFYQDTLDDKKEDGVKSDGEDKLLDDKNKEESEDDEDDIPLKKMKEEIQKKEEKESLTETKTPSITEIKTDEKPELKTEKEEEPMVAAEVELPVVQEKKPPGPGCGPNGPPGVLTIHRKKGPKKKLQWRPESELEEVRFFDVDENERINVARTSFVDMKQLERCSERDVMYKARKQRPDDNMVEQIPWATPALIDAEIPIHPEGSQSKERIIQGEREKNTLKTIYFSQGLIPDCPAEIDFEPHIPSEPTIIPLNDVTGNPDGLNDFSAMAWPEPKIGGSDENSSFLDVNPFKMNAFNANPFAPPFPINKDNWMNTRNNGPPIMMVQPMVMPPINMPPLNGQPPPNMRLPFMNGPGMVGPPGRMPFGPPQNNFVPGPGPNFGPPGNFNGPPPPNNFNCPPNNFNSSSSNNNNNSNRRGSDLNGGGGNWRGNHDNWRNGPPAGSGDNRGRGGFNSNRNNGGGGNNGGPSSNWQGQGGNVCKQFIRGNCRLGNRCKFIHPNKF